MVEIYYADSEKGATPRQILELYLENREIDKEEMQKMLKVCKYNRHKILALKRDEAGVFLTVYTKCLQDLDELIEEEKNLHGESEAYKMLQRWVKTL